MWLEDDAKIASFVVNGLKQSGFAVDRCADGEEGEALATSTTYDAAIIDVMLPKQNGLALVQNLRKAGVRMTINTDGTYLLGTTLRKEFNLLVGEGIVSDGEARQFIANARAASFMPH